MFGTLAFVVGDHIADAAHDRRGELYAVAPSPVETPTLISPVPRIASQYDDDPGAYAGGHDPTSFRLEPTAEASCPDSPGLKPFCGVRGGSRVRRQTMAKTRLF